MQPFLVETETSVRISMSSGDADLIYKCLSLCSGNNPLPEKTRRLGELLGILDNALHPDDGSTF